MSSTPKILLDAAIKNQIALDQYSHHLDRRIQLLLRDVEGEIIGIVAKNDPTFPTMTEWKLKRLAALNKQIEKILTQSFGNIDASTKESLLSVAELQAEYAVKSFNRAVSVDLFQVTLTHTDLKAIVENTLIDGKVIGQWWAKQSDDLKNRISASMTEAVTKIQIGMVQGEGIADLVGRIRGNKHWVPIMNLSRQHAEALVRTSVMSVANAARMEVYKANADVLSGYEWISTLDNRTTTQCAALDKKRFDLDLKPIDHDIAYPGCPAHWNCRSLICPVTKTWAELVGSNGRSKKQISQLRNIPKEERASMGETIPSQTYDQWLRSQSESTQTEILGPGRFDLWKRNKLDMADLVDNSGNLIPLAELKKRLTVK